MKILYFGTVCDLAAYDQRLGRCKAKPSVASIVFESALLEGLHQNGAQVQIHSFPMIPTFPASSILRFGKQTEVLPCGYSCRWLHTLNLPILKQISRRLDGRRMLKRWLRANAEDGIIVTYSIPPFLVKDVLKYARRYRVKTVAIVADLLRDMYINEQPGLITRLKNRYLAPALALQGEYDGYVYLTEAMAEVVAPGKPFVVMEGIAGVPDDPGAGAVQKDMPPAIMYAGMLHEKYGIPQLLDAFENLKDDSVELWLFGDGTAVPRIQRCAEENPRIRYFGKVSRQEILERERRATLLINPRSPGEQFTRYSFPSKTVEYMLSGTPLVTTRLEGIPEAYFGYVFPADDGDAASLSQAMEQALSHTREELKDFGQKAQQFIIENKTSRQQAARVLAFLEEVKYGQNVEDQ